VFFALSWLDSVQDAIACQFSYCILIPVNDNYWSRSLWSIVEHGVLGRRLEASTTWTSELLQYNSCTWPYLFVRLDQHRCKACSWVSLVTSIEVRSVKWLLLQHGMRYQGDKKETSSLPMILSGIKHHMNVHKWRLIYDYYYYYINNNYYYYYNNNYYLLLNRARNTNKTLLILWCIAVYHQTNKTNRDSIDSVSIHKYCSCGTVIVFFHKLIE